VRRLGSGADGGDFQMRSRRRPLPRSVPWSSVCLPTL
jgi:hypothetical protein